MCITVKTMKQLDLVTEKGFFFHSWEKNNFFPAQKRTRKQVEDLICGLSFFFLGAERGDKLITQMAGSSTMQITEYH